MMKSLQESYRAGIKPLLMITFLFCLSGYGQDNTRVFRKEIDSITQLMFKYTNDRNYDALMDMTHPKLFDLVPKETMVSLFKSMLEGNEEFSVDIPKMTPDYKLSEIYKDKESNTDYAFVNYDMDMSMTFNNESFDDAAKEHMVKMMKLQDMEAEFTSDNTVKLKMLDRITILLNDEATDNKWVMLNYDANSPIIFQLLSAEVIEKAKAYHQNLMLERKKKK